MISPAGSGLNDKLCMIGPKGLGPDDKLCRFEIK